MDGIKYMLYFLPIGPSLTLGLALFPDSMAMLDHVQKGLACRVLDFHITTNIPGNLRPEEHLRNYR